MSCLAFKSRGKLLNSENNESCSYNVLLLFIMNSCTLISLSYTPTYGPNTANNLILNGHEYCVQYIANKVNSSIQTDKHGSYTTKAHRNKT